MSVERAGTAFCTFSAMEANVPDNSREPFYRELKQVIALLYQRTDAKGNRS